MAPPRTSRRNKVDEEDSMDCADIELDTKGIPASQPSFDRKFLVAKVETVANSFFYKVRHPKFNTGVVYRMSSTLCEEIILSGEEHRSFFYGESVVKDGAFRLCAPVHPLFLAIPYFFKKSSRFEELGEILCDDELPAISLLATNEQFIRTVDLIADSKEIGDDKVFRFNKERAIQWLSGRFNRLQKALVENTSLHKSIIENKEVLDRYTFAVLCDNLPTEVATILKAELEITDPPIEEVLDQNSFKRKSEVMSEEWENIKPAAKKTPKVSVAQKQLKEASKGTKSISSFFGKK
ncbi:unnamed protein product, partial [Mesorhabditis belari]|uniref:Ribonuclease H2 subunit B wHTH domain-containing protein n=1 Tax=Mesorhabditis belari TaxID=2138241 RepID=A0AAF3FCK8_9BILA